MLTGRRDQEKVEHSALQAHPLQQCAGCCGAVFAAWNVGPPPARLAGQPQQVGKRDMRSPLERQWDPAGRTALPEAGWSARLIGSTDRRRWRGASTSCLSARLAGPVGRRVVLPTHLLSIGPRWVGRGRSEGVGRGGKVGGKAHHHPPIRPVRAPGAGLSSSVARSWRCGRGRLPAAARARPGNRAAYRPCRRDGRR